MSVELKVLLVSEDAEQQKAFDRTLEDARLEALQRMAKAYEQTAQAEKPVREWTEAMTPKASEDSDGEKGSAKREKQNDKSEEKLLSRRAVQLLEMLVGQKNASTITSVATRVGRNLAPVGRALANSRLGRSVIPKVTAAGRAIASSGAGQAVAGFFGRTAATAAVPAAGAAAGGAGAAAGGGAAVAGGATVAASLGPIGIAAGVAAVALVGTGLTVKAFQDIIHRAADEVGEFSQAISRVQAQSQVRSELARIDRAERTGAGIAQIEAARDRIAASAYEVQTKILEVILKFAPLIEGILDAINAGLRGVDLIVAALNVAAAELTILDKKDNAQAGAAFDKSLAEFLKALAEIFDNNAPGQFPGIDPMLAQILNMPGAGGAPRGANPLLPRGNFP